ncbi:MAG: cupredoxin domain-containing protein [Actinomycetota bacterium]
MSRRSLVLVVALLLGATACGRAESAQIDLGSGRRFVAEVVDPLNDAGRFPAVVVTSDGRPLVAYFGLAEDLPDGEVADARPIGSPSIPGVLLATRNADGVWSRGAIALEAAIPNVDIAFAPAFDEAIGSLTSGTVSGLDLAIDGQDGLHAVWGSVDGLWYATGSSDPASTMPWTVEKVFDSPPEGLSLAVTSAGDPFISFISGGELRSIEGGPGAWRSNPVAPAATCAHGCGTDTAIAGGDPVIAFVDPTDRIALATTGEGGWTAAPIAPGSWPSVAAGDASPVVAYVGDGTVFAATGGGTATEVATIDPAAPLGTAIAVDAAGTVSVAWASEGSGLGFAQGDIAPGGGGFAPVPTGTILGAASPAVVTSSDSAGVFLAWQETSNRDLLLGSLGEGEFAFALPSPTIEPKRDTGMPTTPPTNCVAAEQGVVTVVAQGLAFTDGSCITVPAGEPFQILFDNRDDAAALGQHNIAIFPSANDLAEPLFRGDLVSGPAETTYDVDALAEGRYFFHCDVHPQMTGQVVAEGAGGGGGGGGGGATTSAVVAMGLAFDTSTISLPAGKAVTLTFDNQDAGVPHNIAIFPSSMDLANPLFRGETFNGVASKDYEIPALEPGEYYFHCDVHPTMAGTVVVT